ncbi:atypical chemokine receptor 3-like [Clinocottus analis]|uniref:atypical chemokine receptor 3-like n=1 Tax=Clinocottus analis TaxID=304258 RepID=UPI0035BF3E58
MSLSSSDLTELLELWEELNLTGAAHHNLSRVEAVVCSGAISHVAFLPVLSVLYVFISLVGLAANALVLWLNLRAGRRRRETHLYVLNLAVADLCVAVTLPAWAASLLRGGRWPFGAAACQLAHLVFSVSLFGSIFFLACMSADRYLAATRPAGAPGRKAARPLTCVLAWLLALAASVPEVYFLRAVESSHGGGAVCRPVYPAGSAREWTAGLQLSFFVLGFAVPFPVISVFCLLLAAALPPGGSDRDGRRRAGRRLVLAYAAVFLACWLPFHGALLLDTLALLGALPFSCRLESFLDAALHLTQCCALLHCCVNPVLYTLLRHGRRMRLNHNFLLRYSSKAGLARLIGASQAEDSAVDYGIPIPMGSHAELCSVGDSFQQEPQQEPQ